VDRKKAATLRVRVGGRYRFSRLARSFAQIGPTYLLL